MKQIKLVDGKKTYCFDLVSGTKNDKGIDLHSLHEKTGLFSYDPGLRSTAICCSSVSYIDDKRGKLFYRGHDISELIDNYDFLDVAHLLILGELPTRKSYQKFQDDLNIDYGMLSKLLSQIHFDDKKTLPIDALKIFLSFLIATKSDKNYSETVTNILSLMPMLVAYIANEKTRKHFITKNGYVETFLCNFFYKEVPTTTVNLIQKFLILHMDHEQNASTTAVRIIGATGNSPLNSILSGILALEGSRHGGANEQTIKMLENIATYNDMLKLVENAKNGKQHIFGLGHRVYKTIDPRAVILKQLCQENFSDNSLFQKATQLEELVTHDEYFITRKLYPNLDFYSGILLHGLGIKNNMFLPFFVLARTVGWLAHWKEMNENNSSIIRPRQIYTGS